MSVIVTLHESDFNVEADSKFDSANFSSGIFDDRSFVPIHMMM